jgi:O-antigen/teichoic acid export membrane protein
LASLKKKTINSVKWTTLQTGIAGITGPILLFVMAKFLSPEEFAYIAVILIIIGFFRLLESLGINQAVIQKVEVSEQEGSTLFYFNIALSAFLAILLYMASPVIALFFSLPMLEEYLPSVCIIGLVAGPSMLFRVFLEKQMYFKQLSLIAIIRNLTVLGTTTCFLAWDWGVIGVIYAQIIGSTVASGAILFVAIRFKIRSLKVYFNPKKLLPFLQFGIFISAKQLMSFTTQRLDEVVIGYFLSPEILGTYHFGKNMLGQIRNLITLSFGKVLFPFMTKLKDKPHRLTQAYQRISLYIAFGAFPVFIGIAITAHLFVPVIFGAQWIGSIIVFQIFSITLISLILTANVSTSLLYSVNKPHIVFYVDLLTSMLYFVALVLFARYGMVIILIVYCCYVIFKTILFQFFANQQLTCSFIDYFKQFTQPAAAVSIMAITVLFFQEIFKQMLEPITALICSIIIGIIVYSMMCWLVAYQKLCELKSALFEREIS